MIFVVINRQSVSSRVIQFNLNNFYSHPSTQIRKIVFKFNLKKTFVEIDVVEVSMTDTKAK